MASQANHCYPRYQQGRYVDWKSILPGLPLISFSFPENFWPPGNATHQGCPYAASDPLFPILLLVVPNLSFGDGSAPSHFAYYDSFWYFYEWTWQGWTQTFDHSQSIHHGPSHAHSQSQCPWVGLSSYPFYLGIGAFASSSFHAEGKETSRCYFFWQIAWNDSTYV